MDRQAGFSLVELLVVMTLLAFLSAILLGSLRFGARSWESVLAATDRRDSIAAAHRFLRARVGGLVRSGTAGAWAGAPEIAGDAREIRFTAPWLEALGHGGAYRFRLWQEEDRVRLAWRPAGARGAGAPDTAGERTLLADVRALRIGYFARAEPGRPAGWTAVWADRPAPPPLVRIAVDFEAPAMRWPPLVIRVQD